MITINLCKSIIFTLLIITTTGCTCCIASDAEDNYTLGSALTKLTAAVESAVRYEDLPPGLNDIELLQFATKHDQQLLEPFSEYLIKTHVQNRHVDVLVCDKSGKYAKLEDAGCTSQLDKLQWKMQPELPCSFSIKLEETCQD